MDKIEVSIENIQKILNEVNSKLRANELLCEEDFIDLFSISLLEEQNGEK